MHTKGVYHKTQIMAVGSIYIYLHMVGLSNKQAQWRWAGFFVLVMIVLSIPGDLSVTLSNKYPALLHYYFWRVIAPFQTWASLAVLGVLLWMKTHSRRRNDHIDQG